MRDFDNRLLLPALLENFPQRFFLPASFLESKGKLSVSRNIIHHHTLDVLTEFSINIFIAPSTRDFFSGARIKENSSFYLFYCQLYVYGESKESQRFAQCIFDLSSFRLPILCWRSWKWFLAFVMVHSLYRNWITTHLLCLSDTKDEMRKNFPHDFLSQKFFVCD